MELVRMIANYLKDIKGKGDAIFRIKEPIGSISGMRLMKEMDNLAYTVIKEPLIRHAESDTREFEKAVTTSNTVLNRLWIILVVTAMILFVFGIPITIVSIKQFVKPIEMIRRQAYSIARGDFKGTLDIKTGDEIEQLANAINDMSVQLARFYANLEGIVAEKTAELARANKILEALSVTDGLTGLYNHRYFYARLEEEVKRAERYGHPVSLIISDIDFFKHYNDAHGHLAGDSLLKGVARCIKDNVRGQDIVARYGGEEFSIILPETGKEAAIGIAEKLRRLISEQPFHDKGTQPGGNLTMSFGVSTLPVDVKDMKGLVKMADDALYSAKEGGRNRVAAA